MIYESLHWTINLGIWIGIMTVLISIIWTLWKIYRGEK